MYTIEKEENHGKGYGNTFEDETLFKAFSYILLRTVDTNDKFYKGIYLCTWKRAVAKKIDSRRLSFPSERCSLVFTRKAWYRIQTSLSIICQHETALWTQRPSLLYIQLLDAARDKCCCIFMNSWGCEKKKKKRIKNHKSIWELRIKEKKGEFFFYFKLKIRQYIFGTYLSLERQRERERVDQNRWRVELTISFLVILKSLIISNFKGIWYMRLTDYWKIYSDW